MIITVKDVPQLPYRTSIGLVLRAGNTVDSDDYPGLRIEEIEAIYRAGFIEIDGREPAPDVDPARRVLVYPGNLKARVSHG